MGWATDTYFPQFNAYVENGNLTVSFARLFTDGRDEMSDCLKPSWEPVDDFIITVTEWSKKEKEVEYHNMKGFVTWYEKTDEFEIRTKDKRIANWIWYLAAKQKLTFEQLDAMNRAERFK